MILGPTHSGCHPHGRSTVQLGGLITGRPAVRGPSRGRRGAAGGAAVHAHALRRRQRRGRHEHHRRCSRCRPRTQLSSGRGAAGTPAGACLSHILLPPNSRACFSLANEPSPAVLLLHQTDRAWISDLLTTDFFRTVAVKNGNNRMQNPLGGALLRGCDGQHCCRRRCRRGSYCCTAA